MQTTIESRIFSPAILAMLHGVLEESFRTIVGAEPVLDGEWRDNIRSRLAQIIIAAFERGEHDPLVLQRMAVAITAPAYVEKTGLH